MRRRRGQGRSTCALLVVLTIGAISLTGCGGSSTTESATPPAASEVSTTADVGTLIEAENAAIYAYGVIGAHLTGVDRERAVASLAAHRRFREAWIDLASADGQSIPAAAIAYDLPFEVRGPSTAKKLSVDIETRMISIYESAGKIAADAVMKARARLAALAPLG